MNKQIILAARPTEEVALEHFSVKNSPIPTPNDGEVLLRIIYLSLDPYMRGRMSDTKSYAASANLGEPMVGGTVCQVIESKNPNFSVGDWVLSASGWQQYAISSGKDLTLLDPEAYPVSYALGLLGMPGFTAYMGLLDIGKPQPGETVVVAAATGPVGSTVAQIAKLKGCRVVAIAGGADKCQYALQYLGVDACIDHRADDFEQQLKTACPNGIDVYYENVGGKVFDAVFPLLNTSARIPVCGTIAYYNQTDPIGTDTDRLPLLMRTILVKRLTIRGFIISLDYEDRYPEFAESMGKWVQEGKFHYKEDIVFGIENAAQTFINMLKGKNFGKTLIQVA